MLIVKDTEITNQFEMTILAGKRARDITLGSPIILEPEERNSVTQAIKEVKEGIIKAK